MGYLIKILIIDDEESVGVLVKRNLEHTGEFSVFIAQNGRDGIALAKLEKPDLILLDVVMPEMEGPDVAEALLKEETTKHIPIIFLTAIVTKEDIGQESMGGIGGRNYIAKPVSTHKLIECIKKVLEGAPPG
jgi:CheY-like chemotaxis protein